MAKADNDHITFDNEPDEDRKKPDERSLSRVISDMDDPFGGLNIVLRQLELAARGGVHDPYGDDTKLSFQACEELAIDAGRLLKGILADWMRAHELSRQLAK